MGGLNNPNHNILYCVAIYDIRGIFGPKMIPSFYKAVFLIVVITSRKNLRLCPYATDCN